MRACIRCKRFYDSSTMLPVLCRINNINVGIFICLLNKVKYVIENTEIYKVFLVRLFVFRP